MFQVESKTNNKIYTVYNVKKENDQTFFLIYCSDYIGWLWVGCNAYKPYTEYLY